MKRLLSLPLLALPLLFLSCDSQTLTEPNESDSQASLDEIGPLAAPLPSPLDISCSGPSPGCSEVGGDFYANGVAVTLKYDVCNAEKGTISIYVCQEHGYGGIALKDRCLNHDGAGWTLNDKLKIVDTGCGLYPFKNLTAGAVARGWKVKFTAQGSGYKNSTVYFDTYPGSP